MVPNGWNPVYLNDIADKIMVGIASAATHAYVDIGIRMLRNLNIKEGFIDDSDILFVNEEYELQHKNKRLKAGDILTVRTGYPGLSAVVPKKYDNAQCFTSLITRLKEDVALPDYICRFINSEYGKKYISSGEAGGAQKNVNASILKKMLIPLPPLPEQRKIAKILSTWDKAISTTERLIDNSKQQKKALMQQLLTGKKRLLDDSGKPFEGEWEQLHLSDIAKIKKGKALSSKDLEVGEYPVIAGGKTSPYKHSSYTHEKIITVSASGAYAGFVAYHKQKIWASDCSVIEEKQCSDIQFIYQYLLLNQTKIYSFQSGGAQPHIYPKDIEVLKVNLPEIKEQQKIASVLTNADQEIELLEQQLADLKQEKKALMQQLLTGKRRVKLDDKEVA